MKRGNAMGPVGYNEAHCLGAFGSVLQVNGSKGLFDNHRLEKSDFQLNENRIDEKQGSFA